MSLELLFVLLIFGLWVFVSLLFKIPQASLAWVYGYAYFVFILLPSIWVSEGSALRHLHGSYFTSNTLVFFIAAVGFLLFLVSTVLAQCIPASIKIQIAPRRSTAGIFNPKIAAIALIVAISIFWYLDFFAHLPLGLLLGGSSLSEALSSRFQFRSSFPIDRLIVTLSLVLIFSCLFYFRSEKHKSALYLALVMLLIYLIFRFARLGRDDFLQIVVAFAFFFSTRGRLPLVRLSSFLIPLLFIGWVSFSLQTKPIGEVFVDIFNRVLTQTSYVYFHLNEIPRFGLWERGVDAWWGGDNLLHPQRIVFENFYGHSEGSTAGYAVANLYYIFGPLGFLFFFLGILILLCIDRVIYNSQELKDERSPGGQAAQCIFVALVFFPSLFNLTTIYSYSFGPTKLTLLTLFTFLLFFSCKLKRKEV